MYCSIKEQIYIIILNREGKFFGEFEVKRGRGGGGGGERDGTPMWSNPTKKWKWASLRAQTQSVIFKAFLNVRLYAKY